MVQLFVIDTTSLISYFDYIFGKPSQISDKALTLIRTSFDRESSVRLSIPSIVFVEIFEKWFKSEEFLAKFRAEVFEVISQAPNIEIKPIEQEVLENFIKIQDEDVNLENHDKLILASAMMLECPLITSDPKIIKYVKKHGVIPSVIQ